MRQSVTYKEKSEGFANQTFRLLLVGRSRSGFSSPDSDTYYTLGLAVETIPESSMVRPVTAVATPAASLGEMFAFLEVVAPPTARCNIRGN